MNILWIDNFSPEEYRGGAELTGMYLREKAKEQGHKVMLVTASDPLTVRSYTQFDVIVMGNVDRIPRHVLTVIRDGKVPYVIVHNNSLDIPEAIPDLYKNAKLVVLLEPDHAKHIKLPINDSITYPPYVDTSVFRDYKIKRNGRACYIGLITQHKGVAETIEMCREKGIGIDLYGKTDQPEYLELLKTMPDVKYCGELKTPEDVATVLNTYTYFAWKLNRYGCYGRSLVEAMLCGCKLIVNKENFGLFNYDWDFEDPKAVREEIEKNHQYFWDSLANKLSIK